MKTDEVINWRSLIEHFEQDLKVGDSLFPATDAFKSEEGAKRWSDFKTRIVEHVISVLFVEFLKIQVLNLVYLMVEYARYGQILHQNLHKTYGRVARLVSRRDRGVSFELGGEQDDQW
jgi:hypothetical protein